MGETLSYRAVNIGMKADVRRIVREIAERVGKRFGAIETIACQAGEKGVRIPAVKDSSQIVLSRKRRQEEGEISALTPYFAGGGKGEGQKGADASPDEIMGKRRWHTGSLRIGRKIMKGEKRLSSLLLSPSA